MDIIIDKEFQARLWDTSDLTDDELERSLLEAGKALDTLKIASFPEDGKQLDVLADGHRRFMFCKLHDLGYETEVLPFPSRGDALAWMDSYQVSRRNLNANQLAIVLARLVAHRRERDGGTLDSAVQAVAAEAGVSDRTVYRDLDYAETVEDIVPEIREQAVAELPRAQAEELASLPEDVQQKIAKRAAKEGTNVRIAMDDAWAVAVEKIAKPLRERAVRELDVSQVYELSSLPKFHQHKVFALAESGEFKSLSDALSGEKDVPVTEGRRKKIARPTDTMSVVDKAKKIVGKLQDAVVFVNEAFPDRTKNKLAEDYLKRLASLLNAWVETDEN